MKPKHFLILSLCLAVCSCCPDDVLLSWGDTDVRYDLTARPEVLCDRAFEYPAWRGERVFAEADFRQHDQGI